MNYVNLLESGSLGLGYHDADRSIGNTILLSGMIYSVVRIAATVVEKWIIEEQANVCFTNQEPINACFRAPIALPNGNEEIVQRLSASALI